LVDCIQQSVDEFCMEVPAGGLSPGLTPEEVARRELLEEVGGIASELDHVGQFYTSNGISNEVAYVYLATGVELGETQRELTELMEMRLVPVEEALRMARSGSLTQRCRPGALGASPRSPARCS
jgi:8-oxo-dGTP pyrophosphatase MutT (NUDIX family)